MAKKIFDDRELEEGITVIRSYRDYSQPPTSSCQIALVGEAWGKEEEEARAPFIGPTGRFLNALLSQVGIRRSDCLVTNVFNLRPKPSNEITNLCGPKTSAIPGYPSIQQGKYIRAEYAPELTRLYKELIDARPNITIALGGTACWALLRVGGIKRMRGFTAISPITGGKVLPTYHPAAVLRDWSNRGILLADLRKARAEASFPEIRRPRREVWLRPTIADLYEFERRYIIPSPDLSIDIETAGDQITCIGFAPRVDCAIVVPIFDKTQLDGCYWRSLAEEVEVWRWIRRVCGMKKRIVGQNFLYDTNFLWRGYGISVAVSEDTMLKQHALQPEMEKSLGFLGSIHTSERNWKPMRQKETAKKED